MTRHALFVLLSICLCTACSRNDIEIDGIQLIDLGPCLQLENEEFIINTQETYDSLLQHHSPTIPLCREYTFPAINFSEKTLLGKLTTIKGCQVFYTREVVADPKQQAYVYTIDGVAQGSCDSTWIDYNWITVPKLPSQYTVVFKVTDNQNVD